MQLEQGPIPTLSAGVPSSTPVDFGFSDLVAADTQPLNAIEVEMDTLLAVDAVIDDLPPDDGLDVILDGVDSDLGTFGDYDFGGAAAQLDVSQAASTEDIVNVYQTIPGEAWQPVPAAQDYGEPGGVPSAATGLAFSITNLTRPGATDFTPGETYQVQGHVDSADTGPGQQTGWDVYGAFQFQDGTVFLQDFGATDADGNVSCTGIVQDAVVGAWTVNTFAFTQGQTNNVQGPLISFTVNPVPPGGSGIPPGQVITSLGWFPTCTVGGPANLQAPTISLTNTGSGTNTAFNLGDTWTLHVSGGVNQDVLIWATQNGVPLPREVLGRTDDTGQFTLDGVYDAAEYIGVWQEFYQVGVTVVPGSFVFAVSEGPFQPTLGTGEEHPDGPPGAPSGGSQGPSQTTPPPIGTPVTRAPGQV